MRLPTVRSAPRHRVAWLDLNIVDTIVRGNRCCFTSPWARQVAAQIEAKSRERTESDHAWHSLDLTPADDVPIAKCGSKLCPCSIQRDVARKYAAHTHDSPHPYGCLIIERFSDLRSLKFKATQLEFDAGVVPRIHTCLESLHGAVLAHRPRRPRPVVGVPSLEDAQSG